MLFVARIVSLPKLGRWLLHMTLGQSDRMEAYLVDIGTGAVTKFLIAIWTFSLSCCGDVFLGGTPGKQIVSCCLFGAV